MRVREVEAGPPCRQARPGEANHKAETLPRRRQLGRLGVIPDCSGQSITAQGPSRSPALGALPGTAHRQRRPARPHLAFRPLALSTTARCMLRTSLTRSSYSSMTPPARLAQVQAHLASPTSSPLAAAPPARSASSSTAAAPAKPPRPRAPTASEFRYFLPMQTRWNDNDMVRPLSSSALSLSLSRNADTPPCDSTAT